MNKQEINKILNNWNVGDLISYKKADKGVVNHNYIVKTSKGEFVLRKVAPYKKLSDLRFEIKYLTYLKKHKFSYQIPAPILTKNKKYFLRLNKSYFWMYKFIEGNQVNSFGKPELKEIAKMMAENHNLIEKSKLNNYKGKGNVFAREPVLKELNEFLKKVRKKVVYIHASGYDGQEEHHGLDKGKLNWGEVLNQLDFSKIKKIIIELHHFEDFKETKKALDDYLRNI